MENTPKTLAIPEYWYINNINGHEQDTPRKTTTVHDEGRNQKKKGGGEHVEYVVTGGRKINEEP